MYIDDITTLPGLEQGFKLKTIASQLGPGKSKTVVPWDMNPKSLTFSPKINNSLGFPGGWGSTTAPTSNGNSAPSMTDYQMHS